MAKAVDDKQKRVPAIKDTSASDEYVTLNHLLIDAKVQGWTDAKIGRKMIQHFEYLIIQAKKTQHGECNVCDYPINNNTDVGVRQNFIVHRACSTWSKEITRTVERSITAYHG